MKNVKRFLAVLCSATLIASSSVTAFAEEASTTTTAGTGNVFAYNFDTVVVPTAIKIAFNPQGLPVKIGTNSEGEDVTTTDKIVSLNYGIANKASTAKKVVVKFAANAAVVDGETKDLTFVDEEDKAKAVSETNAGGAAAGDHKIYLRVAPATAQPTINDGSNDGAGADFAVTTEEDGSKSENATGANLANVKMTPAAAAKSIAFATGTNNDAFANIGFALDEATYTLKSGETIDFDTTQSEVASKLELSAFGTKSITGFTFAGMMNENTVWTEANITAISITPTYDFTEKGEEAAVADTHGMITLTEDEDVAEPAAPVAPVTTYTVTYNGNGGTTEDSETETVEKDGNPTNAPRYSRVGYTQIGWAEANDGEAAALNTFTITEATTLYAIWEKDVVEAHAAVQNFNGSYVLLAKKSADEAFDIEAKSDVTSFRLKLNEGNYVDAMAKGMVYQGMVGVTYADAQTLLSFSTLQAGDEITMEIVIDGTTYEATYIQG
jgi:hypothetical protein